MTPPSTVSSVSSNQTSSSSNTLSINPSSTSSTSSSCSSTQLISPVPAANTNTNTDRSSSVDYNQQYTSQFYPNPGAYQQQPQSLSRNSTSSPQLVNNPANSGSLSRSHSVTPHQQPQPIISSSSPQHNRSSSSLSSTPVPQQQSTTPTPTTPSHNQFFASNNPAANVKAPQFTHQSPPISSYPNGLTNSMKAAANPASLFQSTSQHFSMVSTFL